MCNRLAHCELAPWQLATVGMCIQVHVQVAGLQEKLMYCLALCSYYRYVYVCHHGSIDTLLMHGLQYIHIFIFQVITYICDLWLACVPIGRRTGAALI